MLLTVGLTPAIQRVMVFERYVAGHVNRAVQVATCPAGKAVNAARAASLLEPGREVRTVGPTDNPRTCVTVIDRAGGVVTELIEESRSLGPAREAALLEDIAGSGARVALGAGTLSPGAPADYYGRAITRLPGAKWMIDGRGDALRLAIAAGGGVASWCIAKLNAEELRATSQLEAIQDGAKALLKAGATHVVVTDGARAVHAFDGSSHRQFAPPKIRVLNTTGCGDCLAGAMAMALDRGDDFFEAVRIGVAASAASAETLLPAEFDPARMAELLVLIG